MLRPLGDDYCWAAVVGEKGTFGGVAYWFQTWTGDAVSVLSNSLFVGAPLAHLPWGLASLGLPGVRGIGVVGRIHPIGR
jgi:hypothetical protein